MSKKNLATVVATAAALIVAGSALAGKSASSLSLVVLSPDGARTASTGQATYGGQVTFDVTTTQTQRPFVSLRCYQAGSFVYDGWHGFFADYVPEPNFTLASLYWTAGAADCTARLVDFGSNGRERTLATTSFHVAG